MTRNVTQIEVIIDELAVKLCLNIPKQSKK